MLKRSIIFLYFGLVFVLAVATFIEHSHGTGFVETHIYHTGWFCLLWGAIAAGMCAIIFRHGLWRQVPVLLLHLSFIGILAGGLITYLCGRKGYMHLRPGIATAQYQEVESGEVLPLPFSMRLDSFRIEYYPGTQAPADYISHISYSLSQQADSVLSGRSRISMNRIFRLHGFRLYQSSFDDDGTGSWLSVNYDPWGTGVTYAGYLLFGISMLWLLASRRGPFQKLLRHPLLRGQTALLLMTLCLAGTMQAAQSPLRVLNRQQADSLARKQVIYNDRIAPFNTQARDFVQKLTGQSSYKGLSPEQIVSGWMLYPDSWRAEPMIRIKSGELRKLLGLKSSYASLSDLFKGPVYRLQEPWNRERKRSSKLGKAIQETDEKVGLILMLQRGTFFRPLPEDGSVQPASTLRIEAELLYNRIPFSKILFMCNLILGVFSFFYALRILLRNASKQQVEKISVLLAVLLHASLLFHLVGYCLRWYIGGRIPLSNGYETMQFMALAILLLSCLLRKRFLFALPFGFLLSGFTLLVSYLAQMNPQITPLIPVLISPWLSIHVSFIMIAYALLTFIMLNSILAFCLAGRRRQIAQLTLLSRLLLYPATFFLGAGIFVGAVWANVSWGRYWAWDPKEVWALITFLVYGAALHSALFPLFRSPRFFHTYMVIAFLTVLMTYFGVNYFLGGMHSYANG